MNTLDREAIGYGAAAGVGIGLLGIALGWLLPHDAADPRLGLMILAMRVIGVLSDLAAGALAGALARRRGAVHGALASLVAALALQAVGSTLWVLRTGSLAAVTSLPAAYWAQMALWTAVGLLLAAGAGAVAARLRGAPR